MTVGEWCDVIQDGSTIGTSRQHTAALSAVRAGRWAEPIDVCFGWSGCGRWWAMAHALARVGQEPRPRDVVVALIVFMALAAVVITAQCHMVRDTRSTVAAPY
jgi:hypothetical protein